MTPAPTPKEMTSTSPLQPEVRSAAGPDTEWSTGTLQRVQPLIDKVKRIIIDTASSDLFEARIVAALQSINKDNDKMGVGDRARWDGESVQIKNSTGKLLFTINRPRGASLPSEMSSHSVRETNRPEQLPDGEEEASGSGSESDEEKAKKDDHSSSDNSSDERIPPPRQPTCKRPAAEPPSVTFECRSDDRDRIKPIVDEVKEILKDIGSYDQGLELTKEAREQNIQFVKQLREKLKILNDKTHKKGLKDIAKWTPCEYIAISDAENKTLCTIMPR